MEWLSNLVTSLSSGWGILLLLIVLVAVYFLVKKSGLQIHTDKISLGDDSEQERFCLMLQWEQINSALDGVAVKLPEQYRRTDKCKTILARVGDVYQQMIMVNHIRNDAKYKELKLGLVLNAVFKRTDDEYFQSKEFIDIATDFNSKMIDTLYTIRQTYAKQRSV